jgi:hypothetical protein
MASLRSFLITSILGGLAACGAGADQGSKISTVESPESLADRTQPSASETAASSATTTTPSDVEAPPERSLLDDPALFGCSLPDALIGSSHLIDVRAGQPVISHIPAEREQLGPHDPANTFAWSDLVSAQILDVRSVRLADPRAPFFSGLSEGEMIGLSREVSGSPLAEIAGIESSLLVGQKYIGSPQEWEVLAAMRVAADGSVSFSGPCGEEFDRQLSAIAAGLEAMPDVDFVARMMEEVLLPGRVADIKFSAAPLGRRGIDPADVPPSLALRLRVIALYVSPLDRLNRTIGLRPDAGITALTGTASDDFNGVINAAIVATGSDVDVIVMNGDAEFDVLATVPSETVDGSDGLVVTIAEDSTVSVEGAAGDRLSELSGMSIDTLLQQRTIRESALVPSTRVPVVEFFPPS